MEPEDFLEHHGVKGMKWGKRKDRSRNPNYTDNQIKRDRQIYGKRGSNRVNKALNRGDSISVARGDEKRRKDAALRSNKYARKGGKVAGFVGGAAAGYVAPQAIGYGIAKAAQTQAGKKFFNEILPTPVAGAIVGGLWLANQPRVRATIAVGAGSIASMLGGDAAVAANMRLRGYDPKRKD